MVHRNVLVGCIAMFSGAAAFQAPMGFRLERSSPALSRSSTGLRMQVDESKVTLGLAEPYLKDVKEAKQAFALLQSKTYSPFSADQAKQVTGALDSLGSSIMKAAENDGKYLGGDVVSTWLYTKVMKNGGFSEFSEKVNGRVAQVAFPCVLLQSFDGDFLDLLSDQISGDPVAKFMDTLPADSKTTAMEIPALTLPAGFKATSAQVMGKVKTVFTEEAELTNSRAAMVAMGVWATTAYIF